MKIWKWWRKHAKQNAHGEDQQDQMIATVKKPISQTALRRELQDVDDAVFQQVQAGNETLTLVYIRSLIDMRVLQELVLGPLRTIGNRHPREVLMTAVTVQEDELPRLLYDILGGYAALLFEHRGLFLKVSAFSPPQRSITPSESESTVLGPQDALIESLEANCSMIQRRLRTPNLKVKFHVIGTEMRTPVAVLYMQNIANSENVERVVYRLQNIEHQGVVALSILQQMLEDKPYSPFPLFFLTGRPDNVVNSLLDGRVVVMLDGSPEALICPASFLEMFTSPEDLYNRWTTATLLRSIRFGGFFVTILLTSSYVSVLTFHPEMLPPNLLTLLSESRARVPFPPVIEVLFIELTIEVLREAGARMPTKIGQTLGIVGGIVIGTASVEAGLASNILIVLVATSALLSFLPTNYLMSNAARFVRYVFIIMAGIYGMFGQMIALAVLMAHLTNLTSLGTPYMSAIPRKWSDLANAMFRAPMPFLITRMGISRAKKELTRPVDEE